MAGPSDSTLPPASLTRSASSVRVPHELALVLLWSRDEPGRAGEALLFPRDEGATWTFGRDEGEASSGAGRVHFVRQRPGGNEPTGPVKSGRVSRTQLRVRPGQTGTLVVENAGRCPLLHEGREVGEASVRPGELVELQHEMVFLCARRPRAIPRTGGEPLHPFGAPDALGFVGESPAMWDLRQALAAVARRPVHVLVLGHSGTGKELAARAIHALSPRAPRPLVARNASTLPEGLLDAELFGHARGYPNAGSAERPGLIGEADGGTLFLDEIGELPESLQAHLLRLLDGGDYHRLGEARARRADLRFVGATNRPESALKHDVLARLTARVTVPDLDARREDIPLLVHHLLRRQAAAEPALAARFFPGGDTTSPPRVAPELITALVRHPFTTHLRELDALLLVATLEGRGKYVGVTDGVRRILAASTPPPEGGAPADTGPPAALPSGLSMVPRGAPSDPPAVPRDPPASPFTAEEERRLRLQREHGFRAAACAADERYGANRQSADFHLRHLLARALQIHGYRVAAAEALLAGEEPSLRARVHERMTRFLQNLEERRATLGRDALARSLTDEWRGAAPVALDLLSAMEAGVIH